LSLVHDGERRAVAAAVKGPPDAIATGKLPTASGDWGDCVQVPSHCPSKILRGWCPDVTIRQVRIAVAVKVATVIATGQPLFSQGKGERLPGELAAPLPLIS